MITVLNAFRDCAKTHKWTGTGWETTPFDNAKTFVVEPTECNSIDDMFDVLRWLETQPRKCIIHGELIEGRDAKGGRLLHNQPDGSKARFRAPDGARWLCFDIDEFPCPDDLRDGEDEAVLRARIECIRQELPADFRDTTFVYSWSSSAGIGGWDKIKAHLWFWIDNPQPLDLLRARAEAEAWPCDRAPINPVQIHYTAGPVFIDREDPLAGRRTGLVRGMRDSVLLSDWAPKPRPRRPAGERLAALNDGRDLDEMLDRIGAHLHGPISAVIWHYLAITPEDARDQEWLFDQIRIRVMQSPRENAMKDFDDAYLQRSWDGADCKVVPLNTEKLRLALARQTVKKWNSKKKGTRK